MRHLLAFGLLVGTLAVSGGCRLWGGCYRPYCDPSGECRSGGCDEGGGCGLIGRRVASDCGDCGGGGCGLVGVGGCHPCAGHVGPLTWLFRLIEGDCYDGQSCGERYWGEWSDRPDCGDPCDRCGNFIGRGRSGGFAPSGMMGGCADCGGTIQQPVMPSPTPSPSPAPQPTGGSTYGRPAPRYMQERPATAGRPMPAPTTGPAGAPAMRRAAQPTVEPAPLPRRTAMAPGAASYGPQTYSPSVRRPAAPAGDTYSNSTAPRRGSPILVRPSGPGVEIISETDEVVVPATPSSPSATAATTSGPAMMAEPAPIGARIASDDARPVRPEWRPKR